MQEGASGWNLIWLLVDGVRSYHCPDDELGLGRLDVMDRFAERAVEFTTMVTVAPSTVMSLSSMFTSVPSYLLSRSFEAFRYDQGEFRNLGSLLAEAGYERFAVSFYREARRYFREILKPVPARFLPSGSRSWEHWDGATVETAATSVLRSSLPEPVFTFIHINGRRDPSVSDRVARLLNVIEEQGLYERSVVVMCSDHGFPDPSRKSFNELIKRRGPFYNRHDLILTDDNVIVPFLLWYPGCRPKKVDEMVSTLDSLKLAGVRERPTIGGQQVLGGDLKVILPEGAPPQFMNQIMSMFQRDLQPKGFFLYGNVEKPSLYTSSGELVARHSYAGDTIFKKIRITFHEGINQPQQRCIRMDHNFLTRPLE